MSTSVLSGLSTLALKANALIAPTQSTFVNNGMNGMNGMVIMKPEQGFLFFLILVLLIFLTMWLGAYVFNTSVVKIFPDVKKVSFIDFFGLYIVIHILFC